MDKKNLTILTFIVVLSSSLYGCFPIIAGTGIYSAMVLADRRPVSITTIDRGIQLELDASMKNTLGENGHVNVNVFNQKVLLTGEVKNQAYRDMLVKEAQQKSNVKKVFDELTIGLPSSAEDRLEDGSIFSPVKARFIATTDIPSNSMKIVVEGKKVYLMGIATDIEAKAAATVASRASGSIKEVIKLFDIISEEERRRLDSKGVPEPKK